MKPQLSRGLVAVFVSMALSGVVEAAKPEIKKIEALPALSDVPMHIGGRVATDQSADGGRPIYRFQWPGVYFAAAFSGERGYFRIGEGDAIYHVIVDDEPPVAFVKPAAGTYGIDGLARGAHTIRVEVVSENQAAPARFGGLAIGEGSKPGAVPSMARQIEFIGDSHTVGYGNTSPKRECTREQVWLTTDTSQAFGPITAKHYHADYQINAISGRGVVRNYNGFRADSLPQMYPYDLFDKKHAVEDRTWRPQIIVIDLGTNDFSTALNPGEPWATREALHADFERSYVAFLQRLRAGNPEAFFVLAATDGAEGEIQAEVRKVVDQALANGEKRIAFVPFNHLELTACDWHPSLADHRAMSAALIDLIDRQPEVWHGR